MFLLFSLFSVRKFTADSQEFDEYKFMEITSPVFENNDDLPTRYGYARDNVNPTLIFSDVPPETQSLALIMDDPDAPGETFTHWVIYNIGADADTLLEGELPLEALQGINDYGRRRYGGPKPPSGTHRYFFKLYALDSLLDLEAGATSEELQEAMENHIIDKAEIIGLYSA